MSLPYEFSVKLIEDEGEKYYFAKFAELDGCMTDGETLEELAKNIPEAMRGWLETCIDNNIPIPEPNADDYSGKFLVRIPRVLHKNLATQAKKEGVSLNQYALYKLSI